LAYSHQTILEFLVIKCASEERHVMNLVRGGKEDFFMLFFDFHHEKQIDWLFFMMKIKE